RISRALHGPFARARARGTELPAGLPAVAGFHVPDSGRAVRVLAAPGHDSALTAADAAVCAALDPDLPAVAEHLLGARPARALRRREEELDPSDRSREPAERNGAVDSRRNH